MARSWAPSSTSCSPDFQRNDDRLQQFINALPGGVAGARRRRLRHVIEFRHPSWYATATYDLLAAHDVSLCVHDKRGSEIEEAGIGGGFYLGGPAIGGSLGGIILLILIVMLVSGKRF